MISMSYLFEFFRTQLQPNTTYIPTPQQGQGQRVVNKPVTRPPATPGGLVYNNSLAGYNLQRQRQWK